MSNEFTDDTTQWTIADEGVYVENPEFIHVITDTNSKILAWIDKEGNIGWKLGIPTPIKEEITKKFQYDSEPTIGSNNLLTSGIIAETYSFDETFGNEYSNVVIDKEGKLIYGITNEGKVKWFGDHEIKDAIEIFSSNNKEYLKILLDSENHIIAAIKKNGTLHVPKLSSDTLDSINKDIEAFKKDYNKDKKSAYITPYTIEEYDVCKKVAQLQHKNNFTFLFNTDNHLQPATLDRQYSHAIVYSKIAERVGAEFIANGGDIFNNISTESSKEYSAGLLNRMQSSTTPFVYIHGNHESNQGWDGYLDENTLYGFTQNGLKHINVHRNTEDENTQLYYYFDIEHSKTRVFVLDSSSAGGWCGYSDLQVEWFKNAVNNLPSGYSILVFCHIPFYRKALWNNHANVYNDAVIREFLQGKVNSGLTILGVVHGHMHWDNVIYNDELHCPFIATTSDIFDSKTIEDDAPDDSYPTVPYKEANTYCEYSADLYNFNIDEDIVSVIRFGAGKHRYIHRESLSVIDSIPLPSTKVISPIWEVDNKDLASIRDSSVIKLSSGMTTLKAYNDSEVEFWNIKL